MNVAARPRQLRQANGARGQAGAHAAALWGLAARGLLYLLLALLSIELVAGSSTNVDTRGALHRLARDDFGTVVLVLLASGFAGFALWHLYVAFVGGARGHEGSRRLVDAGRAVVYGLLCALAVSFLATPRRSGNSDQTDQTWTARVLQWSGGRHLVGAVGIAVIGAGVYLLWRAVSGHAQDEPAVLDAAPRETPTLHLLGAVGNVARGALVALVGVFVLSAAIEYDPNDTVGLDGALKRLLDESFGDVLVVLVALGFAAFGVYSIARAWVNRQQATRPT